jgi:hypothetical protein
MSARTNHRPLIFRFCPGECPFDLGMKVAARVRRRTRDRAHRRIQQLVRAGKIPAASECTCTCGKPARYYHHPNGYDGEAALDVVPLCADCHDAEHGGVHKVIAALHAIREAEESGDFEKIRVAHEAFQDAVNAAEALFAKNSKAD